LYSPPEQEGDDVTRAELRDELKRALDPVHAKLDAAYTKLDAALRLLEMWDRATSHPKIVNAACTTCSSGPPPAERRSDLTCTVPLTGSRLAGAPAGDGPWVNDDYPQSRGIG
jgi:hypothetical protein